MFSLKTNNVPLQDRLEEPENPDLLDNLAETDHRDHRDHEVHPEQWEHPVIQALKDLEGPGVVLAREVCTNFYRLSTKQCKTLFAAQISIWMN